MNTKKSNKSSCFQKNTEKAKKVVWFYLLVFRNLRSKAVTICKGVTQTYLFYYK